MEYHLMCQSRIEKPGENITPSCGHGQKVDFFFFNERFEFVEQIVFFLYQRTRDLITRIMFFEIIFHSGQPDIVPHIFLRLDMYKMHTETERGKRRIKVSTANKSCWSKLVKKAMLFTFSNPTNGTFSGIAKTVRMPIRKLRP